MKDILISVKQQKREIVYIFASILLAVCINIYAIISYGTDFRELYTQWFTTLIIAIIIYFGFTFFRVVYWALRGRRNSIN